MFTMDDRKSAVYYDEALAMLVARDRMSATPRGELTVDIGVITRLEWIALQIALLMRATSAKNRPTFMALVERHCLALDDDGWAAFVDRFVDRDGDLLPLNNPTILEAIPELTPLLRDANRANAVHADTLNIGGYRVYINHLTGKTRHWTLMSDEAQARLDKELAKPHRRALRGVRVRTLSDQRGKIDQARYKPHLVKDGVAYDPGHVGITAKLLGEKVKTLKAYLKREGAAFESAIARIHQDLRAMDPDGLINTIILHPSDNGDYAALRQTMGHSVPFERSIIVSVNLVILGQRLVPEQHVLTDRADNIEINLDGMITRLAHAITKAAKKHRARQNKIMRRPNHELKVDPLLVEIDRILKKNDKQGVARFLSHRAKAFDLTPDQAREMRAKGPGKNKPITVKLRYSEGKVDGMIAFNPDVIYDSGILKVPRLPEAICATILGRPAGDLVDHPFMDRLGPVKSVRNLHRTSHVRFTRAYESMIVEPKEQKARC